VVPSLPGIATADEAMSSVEAGFKALKFFPAKAASGIAYLKSLIGPPTQEIRSKVLRPKNITQKFTENEIIFTTRRCRAGTEKQK